MTRFQKISLSILRIGLGWLMFYDGVVKLLNPDWSAAEYLMSAKAFPNFFMWFAKPEILPITNLINEWGLMLIGLSLIFGLFVRISSVFGILLMILYYIPPLESLHIAEGNVDYFFIDDHIIYALIFFLFVSLKTDQIWGFGNWFLNLPIFSKLSKLRNLIS